MHLNFIVKVYKISTISFSIFLPKNVQVNDMNEHDGQCHEFIFLPAYTFLMINTS